MLLNENLVLNDDSEVLYAKGEPKSQTRACLDLGATAEDTGHMRSVATDAIGYRRTYDSLIGQEIGYLAPPNAAPRDRNSLYTGKRADYFTTTLNFFNANFDETKKKGDLGYEDKIIHCKPSLHVMLSCLGRTNRYMRDAAVSRDMENKDRSEDEANYCVNHADGNPWNNCFYNLEWVTSSENTRAGIIMRELKEKGAEILPLPAELVELRRYRLLAEMEKAQAEGDMDKAAKLTEREVRDWFLKSPLYMSAEHEPQLFGDFLTCGITDATITYFGIEEPAAKVYSYLLSQCNLPVDCQGIVIVTGGQRITIDLADRTPWQYLADIYAAHAKTLMDRSLRILL